MSLFKKLITFGKRPPKTLTLEELNTKYSTITDQLIIETLEENANLSYVSGYYTLETNKDEMMVKVSVQLYFQNQSKEWTQVANERNFDLVHFDAASQLHFRNDPVMKFEVVVPEQANSVQVTEPHQTASNQHADSN